MAIHGKCKDCGNETIDYLCPVCLHTELKELKENRSLAWSLSVGYDGFNTVDSLKSLIDDMVKAMYGELEFVTTAELTRREELVKRGEK